MTQDRAILNGVVQKGLSMAFCADQAGSVTVSDAAAPYRDQIALMATVIFETISACGEVKIEAIEIAGSKKSIAMCLGREELAGAVVEPARAVGQEMWAALQGLLGRPGATPAERRMAIVDPAILQKIKGILHEYAGDFTERLFQNQLKNQNIKVNELHEEDVRRVILALSKATSMIVGRSKGRELSKRLTDLVK